MNPLAQWFTWEGAPCQVGTRSVELAGLSSKSTCNSLLHFEFRVQVWLLHSCVCKSYIDMDHLGTNLDKFVWVPSIAEISSRFFENN